jgi:hypothetical protein
VAFKIRSASACKFKIVGLDAARSGSRVDCSGLQRRTSKVAALGGMKVSKRAWSSPSKFEARSTPKKGGCTMERLSRNSNALNACPC